MNDYKDKLLRYKNFKEKLRVYFERKAEEWVYFYVSHSGRVDLRIVSDQFEDRDTALEYINSSFNELGSGYRKGVVSYHTVEEAELLGMSRPKEKDKEPTWEKAVLNYINQEEFELSEPTERHSKVISFYSFKGGAGRTIALTHTAYLLAKGGKNILLIDLDIEAPSFFNVFANRMDIEYGLVDYLYERVIETRNEESKIKITDIFTQIQLNETLKGSIYAVPAGKLSPEYIFKVTQLQPTFISRKDYMANLISELEKKLDIDIVLIDSRTGINEWGAFSLLDVADDIIFFAYPNKENIGGLKIVMDLLKNSGCKKFTTVFSRIDPKGNDLASTLFAELELDPNQDLIVVPYETAIAIGNDFPVQAALDKYRKIADFLLEDEREKRNKGYLTEEKRNQLLKCLQEVDVVFPNSLNEKIQANKWFIIDEEQVLRQYVFDFLNRPLDDRFIPVSSHGKEGGKISIPGRKVYTDDEGKIHKLTDLIFDTADDDLTFLWHAYFLYVLSSNEESKLRLTARELSDFLKIIKSNRDNEANIIDIFEQATLVERKITFLDKVGDDLEIIPKGLVSLPQDTRVIISDISWINGLEQKAASSLRGLLKCVKLLSQLVQLDIKILVDQVFFNQHKEIFTEVKGNYLEVVWNQGDIEEIAEEFIIKAEAKLKDYNYENFNSYNTLIESPKKVEIQPELLPTEVDPILTRKLAALKDINRRMFMGQSEQRRERELLDLLWGIRTVPGKYSKPMSDWFYAQLQKEEKVGPLKAIQVLKQAVEIELGSNIHNSERLISLESLKLAFERKSCGT